MQDQETQRSISETSTQIRNVKKTKRPLTQVYKRKQGERPNYQL